MASSDVTAVTKYFAQANEGFTTTLGSTIVSGATSVPLNSTSNLTDTSVFVGIIEPGATGQQVFTGTVDVGGSQITGVKWTRGSNTGHAGGVTIVDYTTGTAFNMLSAGILKQHTQAGAHTGITTDTLSSTGNVTVGGTLTPTGGLSAASVSPTALATGAGAANVSTGETTASTSYADLATTTDTVTATIGANGLAIVIISANLNNNTADKENYVSFAASGANTIAASDTRALSFKVSAGTGDFTGSFAYLATGLTAGSTVFKMKYRVVGGTGTFGSRNISVVPL